MFGFQDWTRAVQAARPEKIFETAEYTKWRGFRDTEDSPLRHPGHAARLARLPYGAATKPVEEFDYEEAPNDADGKPKADGATTTTAG